MLTSPQLTAEWENNLTQIAKGAADAGEFMQRITFALPDFKRAAAIFGVKATFLSSKKRSFFHMVKAQSRLEQ